MRELDQGDTLVRVYQRDFPLLEALQAPGKKNRRMMKQPWSNWRSQVPGPAIDPVAKDGTDKTDGYNVRQGVMMYGWAEYMRSVGWLVSPRQQAAQQADVASMIAEAQMDDKENFARSLECLLGSTQAPDDGSTSGVAKLGALLWYLHPTPSGANAATWLPPSVRVAADAFYTGTLSAFTDTYFRSTYLKAIFGQVNKAVRLRGFVGFLLKKTMSDWGTGVNASGNQIATRQVNFEASKPHELTYPVDFFQFDGGVVTTELTVNLACDADTSGAQAQFVPGAYTPRSGVFLNVNSMPSIRYFQAMRDVNQDPNNTKGGGQRGFTEADLMLYMPVPMGQGAVLSNQD